MIFFKVFEVNKYPSISLVLQVICVLFHGQFESEQGFNSNKAILQKQHAGSDCPYSYKGYLKVNKLMSISYVMSKSPELQLTAQCTSTRYRNDLEEIKE